MYFNLHSRWEHGLTSYGLFVTLFTIYSAYQFILISHEIVNERRMRSWRWRKLKLKRIESPFSTWSVSCGVSLDVMEEVLENFQFFRDLPLKIKKKIEKFKIFRNISVKFSQRSWNMGIFFYKNLVLKIFEKKLDPLWWGIKAQERDLTHSTKYFFESFLVLILMK